MAKCISLFKELGDIKLGSWISVDMTPERMRRLGFSSKRGYTDFVDFKITHLFEDYAVGLTGSNAPMVLPYEFLDFGYKLIS